MLWVNLIYLNPPLLPLRRGPRACCVCVRMYARMLMLMPPNMYIHTTYTYRHTATVIAV